MCVVVPNGTDTAQGVQVVENSANMNDDVIFVSVLSVGVSCVVNIFAKTGALLFFVIVVNKA